MTATGLFNRLRMTSAAAVRQIGIMVVVVVMASTFQICGFAPAHQRVAVVVGWLVPGHSARRRQPCRVLSCRTVRRIGDRAGYRDAGSCPVGGEPLLKPVVAGSGDVVELSPEGITVNERTLPHTEPLAGDTKNGPLTSWPAGRYTVGPDSIWVGHHTTFAASTVAISALLNWSTSGITFARGLRWHERSPFRPAKAGLFPSCTLARRARGFQRSPLGVAASVGIPAFALRAQSRRESYQSAVLYFTAAARPRCPLARTCLSWRP